MSHCNVFLDPFASEMKFDEDEDDTAASPSDLHRVSSAWGNLIVMLNIPDFLKISKIESFLV